MLTTRSSTSTLDLEVGTTPRDDVIADHVQRALRNFETLNRMARDPANPSNRRAMSPAMTMMLRHRATTPTSAPDPKKDLPTPSGEDGNNGGENSQSADPSSVGAQSNNNFDIVSDYRRRIQLNTPTPAQMQKKFTKLFKECDFTQPMTAQQMLNSSASFAKKSSPNTENSKKGKDGAVPIPKLPAGELMVRGVYGHTRVLLESLWELTHAPSEHRKYFAEAYFTHNTKANYYIMQREIEQRFDKLSNADTLVSLILRREKIVGQLLHFAHDDASLAPNSDAVHMARAYANLLDTILTLRSVTCDLLEEVHNLRENRLQQGPVIFRRTNYLLKVQSDLANLNSSPFGKAFPEISWINNPLGIPKIPEEGHKLSEWDSRIERSRRHDPIPNVKRRGNIYHFPDQTYTVPPAPYRDVMKKKFLQFLVPPPHPVYIPPKITQKVLVRVPPSPQELREICREMDFAPRVSTVSSSRLNKTELLIQGEQQYLKGEAAVGKLRHAAQKIKTAYRGFLRGHKVKQLQAEQHKAYTKAHEEGTLNDYYFHQFREWVRENAPEWSGDLDYAIEGRMDEKSDSDDSETSEGWGSDEDDS